MNKSISILFFAVLGLFCSQFAEDTIVNPVKPLNPEAGRVIKLKKVLKIPGGRKGPVNYSPVAVGNTLIAYSPEVGKEKILGEFPLLYKPTNTIPQPRFTVYKNKLILSHSSEYMVKIIDLKDGSIIQFSRQYKRVFTSSTKKYLSDISDLHVFKNHIWVVTSTRGPQKSRFIDVFDFDGRYVDAFYLGAKGTITKIDGDFIYLTKKEEDYNFFIVKYKVVDYDTFTK